MVLGGCLTTNKKLGIGSFDRFPKDPDPSRSNRIFRVPIPSETNRNVGGPIPFLGHTRILKDWYFDSFPPNPWAPGRRI